MLREPYNHSMYPARALTPGVATLLLPVNPSRVDAIIQNPAGGVSVYIGGNSVAAVLAAGGIEVPTGETLNLGAGIGAWYGTVLSANVTVRVQDAS